MWIGCWSCHKWGFPLVPHELAHLQVLPRRIGKNYQIKKSMLIFYLNPQRNAADQRGINTPKHVCFAGFISSVSAAVDADRGITVGELAVYWNC